MNKSTSSDSVFTLHCACSRQLDFRVKMVAVWKAYQLNAEFSNSLISQCLTQTLTSFMKEHHLVDLGSIPPYEYSAEEIEIRQAERDRLRRHMGATEIDSQGQSMDWLSGKKWSLFLVHSHNRERSTSFWFRSECLGCVWIRSKTPLLLILESYWIVALHRITHYKTQPPSSLTVVTAHLSISVCMRSVNTESKLVDLWALLEETTSPGQFAYLCWTKQRYSYGSCLLLIWTRSWLARQLPKFATRVQHKVTYSVNN